MKKIILVIAIVMCSVLAKAYEVGDIIPQGNFDAVVVYVDESGEHGLMISPVAPTTSGTKSAAKVAGMSEEEVLALNPLPLLPEGEKDTRVKDIQEKMMQENLNGTNGEQNAHDIAAYCEQNGIAMESAFPEVYWATLLGEGWFIPGVEELELYANTIFYGVWKKAYKGHSNTLSKKSPKYINKKYDEIQSKLTEAGSTFVLPKTLCSSTFGCNKVFEKDKANKKKIAKSNGVNLNGLAGLLMTIGNNVNVPYFGLDCFRNNWGKGWYMFSKKGTDYSNYVYAFKRF